MTLQGLTLDGNTVFEIGSITKVFTSTLLADMVARGLVAFDDPVGKYLPTTVKVPSRNGRVITLVDLATQHSGLPRLPDHLTSGDPLNPYADYTPQQMGEDRHQLVHGADSPRRDRLAQRWYRRISIVSRAGQGGTARGRVLTNSSTGVDDIGRHFLDRTLPLNPVP